VEARVKEVLKYPRRAEEEERKKKGRVALVNTFNYKLHITVVGEHF